jgi:hypothetical protein
MDRARVVRRLPFTLQLLHGCSGYVQPVTAGMDSGSQTLGCAATANGKVLYQSDVQLRQDVSKKMQQRAMYRRNRRGRKTRYRKPRWLNRASMRRRGRLAPSLRSKVESHLREKRQLESLLPVTRWKVETASFDIHKLVNPAVTGTGYQHGVQKGFYNVKAYVLHRDGYTCQSGRKAKHSAKLHVHHKVFRSQGGTDALLNLITLCEVCHDALHRGEYALQENCAKTKQATQVGIVTSQLSKYWDFEETFGYQTKFKREHLLGLPKTHHFDAVAICCEDNEWVATLSVVYHKRHVAAGDYQQTKGVRSEKTLPTGKLFGLRKYDLVQTPKGTGFVKGKRSSGYFALMDIDGKTITASVNVRNDAIRISARTTTLTQPREAAIPPGTKAPGIFAAA